MRASSYVSANSHSTNTPARHRLIAVATIVALLAGADSAAAQSARGSRPPSDTNKPITTTIEQGLRMTESDAALRPTMHAFIEAAMSGKSKIVAEMISAKMRANAGPENVARVVDSQIVPFFSSSKGLTGGVTVTNTTDGFGQQGHTYYGYVTPTTGEERRPFVMYVVVEDGRPMVANILVNKFVEGRHH